MGKVFGLFVLLVIGLAGWFYVQKPVLVQEMLNSIEGTPPQIVFNDTRIVITDPEAGLASITVTARQTASASKTENSAVLVEQTLPERQTSVTIPLDLSTFKNKFHEGDLTVEVAATDRSIRANLAQATKVVLFDSRSPIVELLSQQHIAYQGGVELLLFRIREANLLSATVQIEKHSLPLFPASFLDKSFQQTQELFGVFAAIPFGFDENKNPITMLATDRAGNTTRLPVHFPVNPYRQPLVSPRLTLAFLQQKIPPLYQAYLQAGGTGAALTDFSDSNLVKTFRAINEQYRALLDKELLTLLKVPATVPSQLSIFIKPMPAATSSRLGEIRTYKYGAFDAGGSLHNGLDLASVKQDAVFAAQSGKVILAKEFGIYGNAIVIDHGLSLSTLYGHLSTIGVQVGDEVKQGEEIGRSGETGLAGGDHLHFEIRANGIPVTPIEWWDQKWFQDNVTGKIEALRAYTGKE
jgi:murein DD-endopeptidase MepM/ murein hydrolase activator NlpD